MGQDGRQAGATPSPAGESLVRARTIAGLLEVRFERGFTQRDINAVKAIRGRRWLPERFVWTVPHTSAVIAALQQAFGSRLRLDELLPTGSARAAGGAPANDPHGDAVPTRAALQEDAERIVAAMRQAIRVREYSHKTEVAYIAWVLRFLEFAADSVGAPAR